MNSGKFDAVHLHYDQYANIIPSLQCKKKMITSHYPYLENPEPQYVFLYDLLKNSGAHIVCLSDRIQNEFLNRGNDSTNVSILPCGIDVDSYIIDEKDVLYPDRSIVVGKIEPRKRQSFLQHKGLNIDFIGNNSGEAHPFVCLEGMAAGLGLVISEQSTANLDVTKPFITVIPDSKLNDTKFLKDEIDNNRKVSMNMRKEIRQYCRDNFDWCAIIKKYKEIIENI